VSELLLELLSEEIPARIQRRAIEDLVQHLREWLQVHRIPAAEPIHGYVTPRRLTVTAEGIPERLPLWQEERDGPRLGAPQAAIDGFLRSVGVAAIEECEVRDTGRGEFYFAKIERPGHAASEVLPDLIYSTLMDVAWPKTMRFPAAALRAGCGQ
jgi:glycyl-tRNA synthetase beta chain